MDRLDAMRAFVQVLDSGSFTRAAQRLDRHKATLSQQIRQLEDALSTRLLTRTTRSVAATPEGLAYYRHAQAVLQQIDEVEAALVKGTTAAAGHLRVNVPVAMGRLVFAPEIGGFLERYPRVTVELECSDRTVDLVRDGIDCALRGGPLPDSRLAARRVGGLRFALCAAPRYIERHGLPATPQDLAGHHQVGYLLASTGRLRPVVLERDGERAAIEVPARFVTPDSGAALVAGMDGLGIIVLAEFVASHYLASGALVRVLPGWRCPSLPLHWVTPTARRRAARVQVFIDWATALLRQRLGPAIEVG